MGLKKKVFKYGHVVYQWERIYVLNSNFNNFIQNFHSLAGLGAQSGDQVWGHKNNIIVLHRWKCKLMLILTWERKNWKFSFFGCGRADSWELNFFETFTKYFFIFCVFSIDLKILLFASLASLFFIPCWPPLSPHVNNVTMKVYDSIDNVMQIRGPGLIGLKKKLIDYVHVIHH